MALTFDELRRARRLRVAEVLGKLPTCWPCHWMTAVLAELGDVAYLILEELIP